MTLPVDNINKEEEAKLIWSLTRDLRRSVISADPSNNRQVIHLYYQAKKWVERVDSAVAAGLTLAQFGAILESHINIVWADISSVFLGLKQTDLPAYTAYVLANGDEITAQQLGAQREEYKPISAPVIAQITILIDAIKARFPA
jgi:hypothetical protein